VNLWQSARIALPRPSQANKMRTGLTMLGWYRRSPRHRDGGHRPRRAKRIRKQFESMGTNLLGRSGGSPMHRPGRPGRPGRPARGATTTLIPKMRMPSPASSATRSRWSPGMPWQRHHQDERNSGTTTVMGARQSTSLSRSGGRRGPRAHPSGRALPRRVALLGRTVVEALTGDRTNSPIGQDVPPQRASGSTSSASSARRVSGGSAGPGRRRHGALQHCDAPRAEPDLPQRDQRQCNTRRTWSWPPSRSSVCCDSGTDCARPSRTTTTSTCAARRSSSRPARRAHRSYLLAGPASLWSRSWWAALAS